MTENEATGYEDFADAAQPGDNLLAQIAATAKDQHDAETEVERLTEKLKAAEARVSYLSEQVLPNLMQQADMAQFTTTTGLKIKVENVVRAAIPKDMRPQAAAWLERNGHGGLIKNQVIVEFDRAHAKDAPEALALVKKQFPTSLVKREGTVHPSTLSSWAREQIEGGHHIPADLFGLFQGKRTKISV